MSTTIQIKRSSTASAVPLAGDLEVGELAVNLADKRLFTKKSDGTVVELSTNPTDIDIATLRIDGVEVTASATELNSLDGSTATTADLNKLAAVTATSTELNVLDGFTGSTAELNFVDGVTSNIQTQLDNKQPLDAQLTDIAGLTPTDGTFIVGNGTNFVAESGDTAIASLGITATATELNTLDGITATTTELNYTDGVTSNIQTQLDAKADLSGANFTGNVDVTGTVTADGLTVTSGSPSGTVASLKGSSGFGFTLSSDATAPYIQTIGVGGGEEVAITSGGKKLALFEDGGDFHLYENTGTTAKFVWDSSAEVVDIGINSKKLSLADGFLRFKRDDANKIFIGNTADALGSGTGLINYLYNAEPFIWYQGSERMRIDSSGNVGIGETDPSGYWNQADNLVITGAGNEGITIKSSTLGNGRLVFTDTKSSTSGLYDGGMIAYGHANDAMSFTTNGSLRALIDSSGGLLVGTTASAGVGVGDTNTGHVFGSSGWVTHSRSGNTVQYLNRNTSDGTIIDFRKDGSTVGSIGSIVGQYLYVGTGDTGLAFDDDTDKVVPWNPSTNSNRSGNIDLGSGTQRFKDLYLSGGVELGTGQNISWGGSYSAGNPTIACTTDDIVFYPTGNTGGERARIDSSGNLLVGTTTGNFSAKFVVENSSSYTFLSRRTGTGSEGHIVFQNANGAVGTIFTNGSTTSYNTSSDERLKENIQDTTHTVDINDIRVREFDWKVDGEHQRFGFIAQELEEVYPEAVHSPENPEEMKSVDYSKLVPLLVKEIQTLKARIETLENN